ncbi:MAG: hypothetical protein M3522_12930, partial [Actinomycetota bacterium]|nr:hypothetical protein [Actinomycetota bacterium]
LRVTDREVVCERLEISPRSADEPLSAQRVRDVPFGQLLRRAAAEAARPITFTRGHADCTPWEEILVRPLPSTPDDEEEHLEPAWLLEDPAESTKGSLEDLWQVKSAEELVDAVLSLPPPKARVLSDDERAVAESLPEEKELRDMAAAHQWFVAQKKDDPTIRVAKRFNMSRSSASRRLRRARELGYL